MPKKLSGPRLSFALKLIAKSAFHSMQGTQQKPALAQPDELGITFIGHSSFLLQLAGLNILIDPVFAKWIVLIHRFRRPGLRIDDLPPIDAVLLTHAHMDHLNIPSLHSIVRHTRSSGGNAPLAVVPQGVEDLVKKIGFSQVNSLQAWESINVGGIEITMTPAQHWGARVFTDTHRGFGGYVLRHRSHSVYHSGDTGYFEGFAEIRRRLYPNIALLPIGAYQPDSFRRYHLSPGDAVRAFLDLKAQRLIPMHYGSFSLSEEPIEEPLQLLVQAAEKAGISDAVDTLTEGETRIYPSQWNADRVAGQGRDSEEQYRPRS
ncbi:MAG TPA: MBL fold metallo-hydrolase [Silvibacterium sp.]|nr:MBL fold metallo-hydrolase [Silvibacterium sp.]